MKSLTLAVFVSLLSSTIGYAQEILTVPTRPGVTQSVFIARNPVPSLAVALLFPGGDGSIRLRDQDGRIRFNEGNFLVRSRLEFINRGVIPVIFDVPSDQSRGMDDNFRFGEQHATDVSAVIAELKKRYPALPIFVVGTSRGTVSAAALARRMPDAFAGTILTATLFSGGSRPGQQGLWGFNFASIKTKLLFAHHKQDGCSYTPYRSASALAGQFPLISVSGGLPAKSPPCDAFSEHGFLGRESETVDAIVNWMVGKPYPNEIN